MTMSNETFSNNLINSTIYYLLNFEKFKTFQQAARQAAINNNFQIVLFSDDFNTLFSVETRHLTTIEEAIKSSFSQIKDREQKGVQVDVDGVTTYWGPCIIKGRKYYLMLVDNDKNYTQEEIVKLAEIIELAMGMWNFIPLRDPSIEIIRALKRGNKELAASLAAEMKLDEGKIVAVFAISGVKEKLAQKLWAEFSASQGITAITNVEQDEIAGIIISSPELVPYDADNWYAFGEKVFKEGKGRVMHVRGIRSLEEACNGFRLIAETEAFTSMVFPLKHSFTRYELTFVSNCLGACMAGGQQKKNCLNLIKPITGRNDLKAKQLIQTIEVFMLDAGLSTADTAAILEVHANTVQYRLKKVREILGIDITSNTVLPSLMTALAITRIEKEAGPF